MVSRLRMPDLNGIWIDKISNTEVEFANFLSDWTPARFKLLTVNYSTNNYIGIKSKFFVGTFLGTARRTTKEVYFFCIDFSAKDLQTVVRATCNVERIVFNFCSIHCSSGLDFGADVSYNTKFLSFQYWGSKYFKERTTDWKTDPSKFSLIVDAIGSCGLKASLEKLSISYNHTLSASKVQEELNSKGMSHISVVQENPEPLTS